jgi:hypothetical protein
MEDNNEALTERGSGKGLDNWRIHCSRFGQTSDVFKRKFPKINANQQIFTLIRRGLAKNNSSDSDPEAYLTYHTAVS